MNDVLKKYTRSFASGAFAAAPMYPRGPRIAFAPEGQSGGSTGESGSEDDKQGDDDAAAKAASEKAEADRLAAEKSEKSDDKGLLAEVMEKKNKIKDLTAQLARFDGIDPDAVRALLEEKRSAELAAEEAKGNFVRVKEMMAEEHGKALKALQEQLAERDAKLMGAHETINELTVGRSFSESKFIGEDLVLPRSKARAIYSPYFEVENGLPVGYDKPKGSKDRTMIVDAAGNPVSFDEAIKRIIDTDPEKDSLYRDKSKPGAGSSSQKVDTAKEVVKDKGLYGASRILAGLNAGK